MSTMRSPRPSDRPERTGSRLTQTNFSPEDIDYYRENGSLAGKNAILSFLLVALLIGLLYYAFDKHFVW